MWVFPYTWKSPYRMIPNKMQPAAAWRTIHCHVKAYVLNEITC